VFDIGFFELLIIGVVGLLVIGPEQLPGALRALALWWGRFKRGLHATRTDFEEQIGVDDIRRQLHIEESMKWANPDKKGIRHKVEESVIDSQGDSEVIDNTVDEVRRADSVN